MKYRKVYCKDCGKLLHKMAYYNKTKRCPSCAIKKRFKNPKEIKKISKSQKKRFKDPKKRKQHSIDIKKGMKEPEMRVIGQWIAQLLKKPEDTRLPAEILRKTCQLCQEFPVYQDSEY